MYFQLGPILYYNVNLIILNVDNYQVYVHVLDKFILKISFYLCALKTLVFLFEYWPIKWNEAPLIPVLKLCSNSWIAESEQ